MPQRIASLADITSGYDAIYCDLWGCLHDGVRPHDSAVEALIAFRQTGGAVVLLTNAPRPAGTVRRHLDALGVPHEAYDLVVSSGDATQVAVAQGAAGRRVWHLGAPKDLDFFTDWPEDLEAGRVEQVALAKAEGVVCTGLVDDLTETPEDHRAALLRAKVEGLPLLCANPDIVVDMGSKRLWCAGALARLYEDMGGTALYYGKPHPAIYDLASQRLDKLRGGGAQPRILAIGDGILTDIQGAGAEGIDSVFITSGIHATELGSDDQNFDTALLDRFVDRHQIGPTFVISKLR